jgi:hypothetical protein
MPQIDLSILNQRQTPAFYADTLANRPSAGFIGRIFVSTNTFEFYRDNGTTWDLIGGPGTSTVTGTGANGQVTYWDGASSITGSNNLFFDAVNGHLGIGTITPGTALEIDHDQNTIIQLQQTVATNDNRITFINSGVGLWRLGAFYNAGANDFGLFDIAAAAQPVTVKRATGQVLIGTSTVGSGKLVVASATGDNGVQIVGASAPSLRIDNAESGPTKRAGLGISTATNNFIQGSADRDFCMFNGSTTASPILFGIYDAGAGNVQEAARISPARNFLVGVTVDGGQKLQINGNAIATNYFVKTNGETTKISNPVPSGGTGSNVFIGNGGDSVSFTSGDTGSYNTGIGSLSLNSITTGYRNTSIGQVSMGGLTTGYNNVAVGDNAGRFYGGTSNLIQTNNNCIYIGRNSQASADGNTNEIVIGSSLVGNGSNSVTIGDSSILKSIINGSLLLGYTTASASKLSVNGNASINSNTTTNHSKLCVAGGIKFNNNTDQSINNSAGYGNVYAATTNITAGTGANTIYSNTGSEGSLYVVSGINLTTNARFVDLLCVMGASTATPVVVSSNFNGFPDIRTYTNTGESISLALTGADNYRIFVTGIGCNEKT